MATRIFLFHLTPLVLLVLLAPPALAHPDMEVADGTYTIPPGDALEFPVEIHYHRLVGHVRTAAPDTALGLAVAGPSATPTLGPAAELRVNQLVRCCKGDTWTEHTIRIENLGTTAIQAEIRLVLLHDGIAVTGDDAETGAVASTLFWFALFSLLFVHRLRKGALHGESPRAWSITAASLHAAQWLIAGTLGLAGMIRYGGGPAAGTIAITADLPWTNTQILTTHALILGSCLLLWVIMVGAWTGAARRAGRARPAVAWLGITLGAGTLAAMLVWAIEYGQFVAPILIGLTAAAVPIGGGIQLLRRARRDAAYHHA